MQTTEKTTTEKTNETLREIAGQHLGIDTLETQKSDRLDFHEVSVWGLRDALEAAFEAGKAEGRVA